MTATLAGGEGDRQAIARNERIGTMILVRGALARLRDAGWRAVVVWLVIAVAGLAVQWGAVRAGVAIAMPGPTPGYLIYAALSAALSGLAAAWGVRLFIGRGVGWLKPDRRLFEGGGIMAALSLGFFVISWLYTGPSQAGVSQGLVVAGALGGFVLFFVFAFVSLRLTLWPIGRLMGRGEVTPARSWRLMRRATRGLILGYMLLALPAIVIAAALLGGVMAVTGSPDIRTAAIQLAAAAVGVAGYGLVATLYEIRVENPASVADVFD